MERDTIYDNLVPVPDDINALSRRVIGMTGEIHKAVGPGLPEEAYELAMKLELIAAGIAYSRQHCVAIEYRDIVIARVRLDFPIDDKLVLELKSVDSLGRIDFSQTLRYREILKLGLLINFNVPLLKQGIRRVIRRISP